MSEYLDKFGFRSALLKAMYAATDGISGFTGDWSDPGTGANFLLHQMVLSCSAGCCSCPALSAPVSPSGQWLLTLAVLPDVHPSVLIAHPACCYYVRAVHWQCCSQHK